MQKTTPPLSPIKRALLTIAEMRKKLNAIQYAQHEPIAIIGIGCRFPGGANTPKKLWQLLCTGQDTIDEVPTDRWHIDDYFDGDRKTPDRIHTRFASFLDEIGSFDAPFFSISGVEAAALDPQAQILLEIMWEALEHAHLLPSQLDNSPTGVFVGLSSVDHALRSIQKYDAQEKEWNAYTNIGGSFSAIAGRLSYVLGLTGPSFITDTACSSSLVTVHLACQSLRQKECDLALAGGVNLLMHPYPFIGFSQAQMLAPDGRCKAFDAAANGYVRGEGCGMVVLKRLSDAERDGDTIWAVIRGSAVNQDGPSGGLTVPSGPAQQRVIQAALSNAQVTPNEVGYIEAHGTGTSLGDPIEINALNAVFGHNRSQPLVVGTIKTNIGHTEAAAGIAGLIKTVLALHHREIPLNLHFDRPNPHIAWDQMPIRVPTESMVWNERLVAGVSSFGFTGTNAHVVLAAAPPRPVPAPKNNENDVDRPWHILTLSGKRESALEDFARQYVDYLGTAQASVADICYTATTKRSHFQHRLAVVGKDSAEIQQKLTSISGEASPFLYRGRTQRQTKPRIAFLCTGQGAQYSGMGRTLYESSPTFRQSIDHCAEILAAYLDQPLHNLLFAEGKQIHETRYTQPALFALEYALACLLQAWGIQPDIVAGHSLGEYVAACIAGAFTLEEGLRLVVERGRLMSALPKDGAMAAIFAPVEQVKGLLTEYGLYDSVSIAAVNAPEYTVVSGLTKDVETLLAYCRTLDLNTRHLTVSHAFHSHLMEPMLPALGRTAQKIVYQKMNMPLVSNVTGEILAADHQFSASYWQQHTRQAVQFARSISTMLAEGYTHFIEIGPRAVLTRFGSQSAEGADSQATWLPTLATKGRSWQVLLNTVAQLYVTGVEIDWDAFDVDYTRQRVQLPTYPFQRKPFWTGYRNLPKRRTRHHKTLSDGSFHPLLGQRLNGLAHLPKHQIWQNEIRFQDILDLTEHKLWGSSVLPASAYMEMILTAAQQVFGDTVHALLDMELQQAFFIPQEGSKTMQTVLFPSGDGMASIKIYSRNTEQAASEWTLHASAMVAITHEGK